MIQIGYKNYSVHPHLTHKTSLKFVHNFKIYPANTQTTECGPTLNLFDPPLVQYQM